MSLRKKKVVDLTAGDVIKLFVLATLANEIAGSFLNAFARLFMEYVDGREKEPEV